MKKLLDFIDKNSVNNTLELQECVSAMICSKEDSVPLGKSNLYDALKLDGAFSILKLSYADYENEIKHGLIKLKASQALSMIVSYEDDGESFEEVKMFVEYFSDISDHQQNSTFGVKKVDTLSAFPIKILFSGILPINQLKMTVGKKIDELIHSNDEYFVPRFKKFRDEVTEEIHTPLLPILPLLDTQINDYQIKLVDLHDGKIICDFEVAENFTQTTIDITLLKLFYIYKVLAQENHARNIKSKDLK